MKKLVLFFSMSLLTAATVLACGYAKGFLGVTYGVPGEVKAQKLGFENPWGLYVKRVIEGSAADKAGLKPFDYIYAIDDVQFSAEKSPLRDVWVGKKVKVSYIRNGKARTKRVTLGTRMSAKDQRTKCEKPFWGVHDGYNRSDVGEPIQRIIANTTAMDMGMQEGDIVQRINRHPVYDWDDLYYAIQEMKPGDKIRVVFQRGGQEMTADGRLRGGCDEEEMAAEEEAEEELLENSTGAQAGKDEMGGQGANVLPLEKFEIFPNPSQGQFSLRFASEGRSDIRMIVVSTTGQKVVDETLKSETGQYAAEIDLTAYSSGVYFLKLIAGEQIRTEKLVVEGR